MGCSTDSSPDGGESNFPGGDGGPSGSESNLPEGKVSFDIHPVDLSGILMFEPMGSMGTFPKDHGGFHHNQVGDSEPSIRIYALADGYITSLGRSVEDYWVQVRYSTTISVKLGHVGRFEKAVLDAVGPLAEGQVKNMSIAVKKGQVIGYMSSLGALDMGLHDLERKNVFCYPELFGFEVQYASDIFDYFDEPVRSELLEKAIRVQAPRGGKVDFDVKGTLAGNWFQPGGTMEAFETHFAIGYDYLHPHRVILYNGYAEFAENNTSYNQVWVRNNVPLPETVDLGDGIVKYEMIPKLGWRRDDGINFTLDNLENVDNATSIGVVLFEMLDNETMQVEYFPGQLADAVNEFSGNQRIYVRKP